MEKAQVMIVNDEQAVCDLLKAHLEKSGFNVDGFTDSDKALQALEEKSYHVIVADLKVDGTPALDVIETVRKRGYRTQMIVITGSASPESVRDAEALGAFDYLTKPFELKDLTRKVESAAHHAQHGHGGVAAQEEERGESGG